MGKFWRQRESHLITCSAFSNLFGGRLEDGVQRVLTREDERKRPEAPNYVCPSGFIEPVKDEQTYLAPLYRPYEV